MENLTLMIAAGLISIISSIALFVNWAGNKHIPGLCLIAVGFTVTSIGVLLLPTQGQLPLLVSIVIANSLILLGRIPLLIGLAEFWNQDESRIATVTSALTVVTIAGLYYFTVIQEDTVSRIRIYTAMMFTFNLSYVYIISNGLKEERKRRPVMAVSANFGAFLALMLFTFNAVAEVVIMFLRSGAPLTLSDSGTSILLLGAIFSTTVFAFAIIIMTMEELNVEHQENTIFDPVTTTLNHRTFIEVGQRVMGIALRYNKPVSLLTIEIDNMDDVVKKYGYTVANEMLRHFSLMATDRRRNEDVLARSSFKEFRMLLPGVDEKGREVVINKVNKALKTQGFLFRGEAIPITATISAVTQREEDLSLQGMMQEGEIELYRLKLSTS
jgi:diguanylate cyclase (GGDEF)-like protein